MEQEQSFFEKMRNWVKNSVTIRLLTIGFLILLLLIPVSMVEDLIREREYRQMDVAAEIGSKWGNEQSINGLILTIPYLQYSKIYNEKTKEYEFVTTTAYAHFLPEELDINGVINPEKKHRGIYEVVVYNANLKLNGHFNYPDIHELGLKEENMLWDEVFVSIGISDLRSIKESVKVNWNGKAIQFNPGVESNDVIYSGLSTKVPLKMDSAKSDKINFSLDLVMNGNSRLFFTPVGKETKVNLSSTWKDPSFDGAFLPDPDSQDFTNGFKAEWKVIHLNRPYPQAFKGKANGMTESEFGVNLIMPVDHYSKSMRSAKYAALFITLTFLIFFFVQIINKIRIHPIQYIIVGLALCVFYTLLIAISEHLSFEIAYLISSVGIIGLITAYTKSIFKHNRLTAMIALILVILYTFIYSIIQIQDYALLMGSIGLFITLAILMYLTRKIDWYNPNKNE